MAAPRRPGEYQTGRQDALRGSTPRPESAAGEVHAPQVDEPTRHYIEGVIIEHMGQLAASFEKIMALRSETKIVAEMSGRLHEAEQTLIRERKQTADAEGERDAAKRRAKATAYGAGGAIASVVGIFVAAWSGYRDTRDVAQKAAFEVATEAVEQKAVPIELKATNTDVRITAVEGRQSVLESEVKAVRQSTDRILELLEPATQIKVPRKGGR